MNEANEAAPLQVSYLHTTTNKYMPFVPQMIKITMPKFTPHCTSWLEIEYTVIIVVLLCAGPYTRVDAADLERFVAHLLPTASVQMMCHNDREKVNLLVDQVRDVRDDIRKLMDDLSPRNRRHLECDLDWLEADVLVEAGDLKKSLVDTFKGIDGFERFRAISDVEKQEQIQQRSQQAASGSSSADTLMVEAGDGSAAADVTPTKKKKRSGRGRRGRGK